MTVTTKGPSFRLALASLAAVAAAACNGNIPGGERPGSTNESNAGHGSPSAAGASGHEGAGAGAGSVGAGAGSAGAGAGAGSAGPNAGGASMQPTADGPAGYLDCPTVAYPGATQAVAQLSTQFQQVCGQCHGSWGEGRGNYPAIPGQLDAATFISRVRQGKGAMPAFSADFVSDAALTSDFQVLKAKAAGSQSVTLQHPSFAWSSSEVDQKYKAGLAMWRTADSKGEACANCHSVDAVDLAMIGYDDATIMRRGLLHLSAPQVLVLVDFVHAQRRRFNITKPCSPDWRPFQPGGKVLSEGSIADQEAVMAAHLKSSGLLVATGKVETVADAHKAWDELAAVDLRKFPIGIPLARWTADGFNGDAHKSFDEWIPKLGYKPTDRAKWIAAADKYLANPTEASLGELDKTIIAVKTDYNNRPDFPWQDALFAKYRAVQIGAHYFRMAVMNKPGWFERSPERPAAITSVDPQGDLASPFETIGGVFQEMFCRSGGGYGGKTCADVMDIIPADIRAELPPDAQLDAIDGSFRDLSHHWWTQNQLFDQTLDNGHAFYWNLYDFRHDVIHKSFMNAHKFVKQVTLSRAKNRLPDGVDMLLNAEYLEYRAMEEPLGAEAIVADAVRLKGNILRMYLLLQRELLAKGAPVWIYTPRYVTRLGGTEGLAAWMDGFKSSAEGFGKGAARTMSAAEAKLWGSDTVALVDEVRGLMAKAKDMAIGVDLGQP